MIIVEVFRYAPDWKHHSTYAIPKVKIKHGKYRRKPIKICPFCEEEEIQEDDDTCFFCAYEAMDDIERESI